MSFLGYIEKLNILVKTAVEIVWASFGKNWAIFYFNIWSHWKRLKQRERGTNESYWEGRRKERLDVVVVVVEG